MPWRLPAGGVPTALPAVLNRGREASILLQPVGGHDEVQSCPARAQGPMSEDVFLFQPLSSLK